VSVARLIDLLEEICGRTAIRVAAPKPPGDVERTCASIEALSRHVGFEPATPLETGLRRFVEWYREWARL